MSSEGPTNQVNTGQPKGKTPGFDRDRQEADPLNKKGVTGLTAQEQQNIDNLMNHVKNNEFFKATRFRQALANAANRKALDEVQKKYYKQIAGFEANLDKQYEKTKNQFKNSTPAFVSNARGDGESFMQRLSHVVKFNEQSMAISMIIHELVFFLDFLACITGLKMELIERHVWDRLKQSEHVKTYDPDDYPYPQNSTNDSDALKESKALIRKTTEDKLLDMQLFHTTYLPSGKIQLEYGKGPITDPSQITYELCAANGVVHRPDNLILLRKSVIDISIRVMGFSPDALYTIQNQMEGQSNNKTSNSAAEMALDSQLAKPRPVKV